MVASEDKKNLKFTPEQVLTLLQNNAAKIFPEDANRYQQAAFISLTGIIFGGIYTLALKYIYTLTLKY